MLSRSLLQQVTRSTVRSSSAVAAFSTTRSACLDFVPPQTAKVTPPTDSVPDVQTFLTKIGRGAVGAADNFESWQDFMTMSSFQMKQKGIETRVRRYILAWREKFTKGEELIEIKRGKKSWGGERRRKANKAEFIAQQYRKAHRERLEAENSA